MLVQGTAKTLTILVRGIGKNSAMPVYSRGLQGASRADGLVLISGVYVDPLHNNVSAPPLTTPRCT